MKKLTLLYIILAIMITTAVYFFFFMTDDPEPVQVTDDASVVQPEDNPNYDEYMKSQEELRNNLGQ